MRLIKHQIIIVIMMTIFGCGNAQVESRAYDAMLQTLLEHSVPEISVDSLQKTKEEVTLLDARSKEEFEVSHIKGAKWVGYDGFDTSQVDLSKDSKIVVYCSVGKRSENITKKLREAGYKDVSNLYGGIFEWVNQDNPVYRNETPTDSIHAYSRSWGVWLKKGKKVYTSE